MRLVTKKPGQAWLEEGTQFDGYVVERVLDRYPGTELRYLLRAPDGDPATLITPPRPSTDRRERARFRQLGRRRADLEHAALVPVRAFGEHAGQPYLITDALSGWTFADLLDREAPLEPGRLVAMLTPVAELLDLAHGHGLVHMALDGDSLLMAGGDRLMFDSFGALAADGGTWSIIQPRDLWYWPPEQVRGLPLTPAGNVYSLAALMVHALSGEAPYDGDRAAVTYSHLADPAPRVSERVPELGREIDAVVAWGMSKSPLDRPGSARALIDAASEALGIAAAGTAAELPPPRLRLVPSEPEPTHANGGAPAMEPMPAWPAAPRRSARSARTVTIAAVALAAACGAVAAAVLDPFGGDSPARTAAPAWDRLAERRTDLRAQLAEANTPQEQAAASTALAGAYGTAARSDSPPRMRAAARDARTAYSDLATAAEAGDEAAFAEAGEAVERAERAVAAATAR